MSIKSFEKELIIAAWVMSKFVWNQQSGLDILWFAHFDETEIQLHLERIANFKLIGFNTYKHL